MSVQAETFQAGIYDMPESVYHADPVPGGSLSSSGARKLLPPSCPARFRYEQDHPVHRDVFDLGTAAHRLVLGAGAPIAVLDADDWKTKASREWRDAVRAEGSTPLLRHEHEQVQAMAAALRQHPIAGALLDPERGGHAEQSLFFQDETGVWCRARADWLPGDAGWPVISDYKTARSADPSAFAKSVAQFSYHVQHSWYVTAYHAVTGVVADFVFLVQEKEPPYLVTVCQLDAAAVRAGRELCRQAIEIYRDCREADVWPGYADDIELISLPAWARPREDW